jgi:hopanoid-associated phosphorylase
MIVAAAGMLREAALVAGPGVTAVAGGGRPDLLEQRLKAVLGPGVEGIISIGLGGALDGALKVGDVVIGTEVLRARGRWPTDADWSARLKASLPGAVTGAVYGSDDMVLGVMDKAKLRAKGGAVLVDMESHVAAKLAKARGLPFAVLRVVSDTAGMSLPGAVLAGMTPAGGMNLLGVLGALAKDPRQLPALMRVGRDAGVAFKALEKAAGRIGSFMDFDTNRQ